MDEMHELLEQMEQMPKLDPEKVRPIEKAFEDAILEWLPKLSEFGDAQDMEAAARAICNGFFGAWHALQVLQLRQDDPGHGPVFNIGGNIADRIARQMEE